MTTDWETLITAPKDPAKAEMTKTRKQGSRSSRSTRRKAATGVHGRSSKPSTAGPRSLLDGDRRSERQAVIDAFRDALEAPDSIDLAAITLTTARGTDSTQIVPVLAERVAIWHGGIWLVPQAGDDTSEEHHHGLLVAVDAEAVITAWLDLANGTASRDKQQAKPIHDLRGWLSYCRREAGFDLTRTIVSGLLRWPWSWALGRCHQPLSTQWWTVRHELQPDAATRADLASFERMLQMRRRSAGAITPGGTGVRLRHDTTSGE